MIVVPALDLRDGACVQLRGGDYADELVRLGDPVAVAASWRDRGAAHLHVVDLDAATGRGENRALVEAICALPDLHVQVGGGIRNGEDLERVLAAGAARVVLATRAVEDPGWLASIAATNPGRVALGLDVRRGVLTTRGWQLQSTLSPLDVLARTSDMALAAVVATAVDVEGTGNGPDLALVEALRAATALPLWVAGGVATRDHLASLAATGVDAAVVGTALYTGALGFEGLNEEAWR